MKIGIQAIYRIASVLSIVIFISCVGCAVKVNRARTKYQRRLQNHPPVPHAVTPAVTLDHEDFSSDYRQSQPLTSATNKTELPSEFWEMTLDEVLLIALQDSKILRSLNATSVVNPQGVSSSFDSAITSTDPNFGIEAALSQFDVQFSSQLSYAKNDDVFNNPFLGANAQEVRDDVSTGGFSIFKTNGLGTQFGINSNVVHSQNNSPGQLFPHSWTTVWEATVRHPLLQGSGSQFNQISGPNNQLGFRNSSGVLISRINRDITNAQFDRQLREMVSEVINAYWRLELAYKNFEAIRSLRDSSLKTWKMTSARNQSDLPGGEADKESQAQEQYYQFEGLLLNALNGSNTSGQLGVFQAEADLRRLLNLPQSEGQLIKPVDEAASAGLLYDWNELVGMTLESRVELDEQRLRVRQRELEYLASKNFLLPRLDSVVTYRNNGFGDDLAGGGGRFSSALGDALSNDHGEWELGLEYNMTIGFRQAHSAVRNAELGLRREKQILQDQERQIIHDLGSSLRDIDLRFAEIEVGKKRLAAAQRTVDSRLVGFEADLIGFDELLESQRRLLDSKLSFFQILSSYEIAKANLLRQSGQLLPEYGVSVIESE